MIMKRDNGQEKRQTPKLAKRPVPNNTIAPSTKVKMNGISSLSREPAQRVASPSEDVKLP